MPDSKLSDLDNYKISQLEEKVKDLSQLHRELDKKTNDLFYKLRVAYSVALVLGALTFVNGGYSTYVYNRLVGLEKQLSTITDKIPNLEKRVDEASILLDVKKEKVINDIESIAEAKKEENKSEMDFIFHENMQRISRFSESKKNEISDIGIHKIKNSLSSIVLKDISIVNNKGKTALSITTDNEGNGSISVMSKEGYKLLTFNESHHKGAVTYYDHSGNNINNRTETYSSR